MRSIANATILAMVALIAAFLVIGVLGIVSSGCTPAQQANAQKVLAVGAAECQLAEQQPEPAWVYLVCAAEQAGQTLLVKIPKSQYLAMKSASAPAKGAP